MTDFLARADAGGFPEIVVMLLAAMAIVALIGAVVFVRDARRARRELERRRTWRRNQPPVDPIETNVERHFRSLGRHP